MEDERSTSEARGLGRSIKTVWPTIALWPLGVAIVRLWNSAIRANRLLTVAVGAIVALPAAALYLWRIRPWGCLYYRLTESGAAILRGMPGRVVQFVPWDEIRGIEIHPLPGLESSSVGDIVFLREDAEGLRWQAVPFAPAVAEQARRIWMAQRAFRELLARKAS